MKKIFTLTAALLIAVAAGAQTKNYFVGENVNDGWLYFNSQAVLDNHVGMADDDIGMLRSEDDPEFRSIQLVGQSKGDYKSSWTDLTSGLPNGDFTEYGALVLAEATSSGAFDGGGVAIKLPALSTLSFTYFSPNKAQYDLIGTYDPFKKEDMQARTDVATFDDPATWRIVYSEVIILWSGGAPAGYNTLTGQETKTNNFEPVMTIQSDKPMWLWIRNRGDKPLYIHGIKITVPSSAETLTIKGQVPTGISTVAGNTDNTIEVYTIDGQNLGKRTSLDGLSRGTYIVKQGGKVRKQIKL